MHGNRRNYILLSTYLGLVSMLIMTLGYFIWQSKDKVSTDYPTNPQVEKYYISATVKQVHISSRALVVNYHAEQDVIVGLLPEAKIFNQNSQETSLADLPVDQKIRIEVKFIGTNSILAGNIFLEN